MARPSWAEGMQQIMPGMYKNGQGKLHFSEQELLEEIGWPCTPQTRAALHWVLAELCGSKGLLLGVVDD